MNESNDAIERNNAAVQRRLRKFHRSPEGRALRGAIAAARDALFAVYRQIALEHWAELGNDASTGWGCVPEGRYQQPRKPKDCAHELANKLVDGLVDDPRYALGAK